MKRLLVTGASGFVGRQVLPLLGGRPFEVHAVSSQPRPGSSDGCTWHQVDLLDRGQRDALVDRVRPEALLHLAWHAKPPTYWSAPENVDWLTASLELFQRCAAAGATRLVGAGSCMEYDWRYGYCSEGMTPLQPATLYGSTKAACGTVLDAWSRRQGLSAAWGRLFFIFGPHDSPLRLVPSLVRALAAGEPAECMSGSHSRDFLYVGDVAAALVALLESDVTGPVNIGSGQAANVGEIARRIGRTLGREDLLTISEGSRDNPVVCANVTRLRHEVGWRPAIDVMTRLDETIRWWQSHAPSQVPA